MYESGIEQFVEAAGKALDDVADEGMVEDNQIEIPRQFLDWRELEPVQRSDDQSTLISGCWR